MKKLKLFATLLTLLVTLSAVVACQQPQTPQTLKISDVTVYANGEAVPLEIVFGDESRKELISYTYDSGKISIKNGNVSGIVAGKVKVTAKTASCETEFIVTVLPEKEYLVVDNMIAVVGDPACEITAFLDESIKNEKVYYTYNSDVISIENNYVTALAEGEATVTATAGKYSTEFYVVCKTINRTVGQGKFYMRENEGWTNAANGWRYEWDNYCTNGKSTIFIGDSFFDCRYFWTDFYNYYGAYDARCFGIGGTTSNTWELFYDTLLKDVHPKNIVVNVGNNNVYNDSSETEETVEDLQRFFNLLHGKMPETKIYCFSITAREYTNALDPARTVLETNAAMKRWCSVKDWITYVDLEEVLTVDKLKDRIHPKLENYVYFVNALNDCGIEIEVK